MRIKIIFLFVLILFISGCVSINYDVEGIEIDKECIKTLHNLYQQGNNVTDGEINNCRIYLIKNATE